MAFRTPVFNLWAEVRSEFGAVVGWSKCQLRGPVNGVFDLEQSDTPTSCRILWEILFPAGSDVRSKNYTGPRGTSLWDQVRLCGNTKLSFIVQAVGDKAAGFSNEYRLTYCTTNLDFMAADHGGLPRVNPEFVPPAGFTPLPIIPRV